MELILCVVAMLAAILVMLILLAFLMTDVENA